jgi:hypothetical protein
MSERTHNDDWVTETQATIERHGWMVQGVFGDAHFWAYTVGLSEGFNHPELVVADICCPRCAGAVLNSIGELVRGGHHFDQGDLLADPSGRILRLCEVDRDNFETGVFAVWTGHHRSLGPPYPEERALEVVFPGREPVLSVPVVPTETGLRPVTDD